MNHAIALAISRFLRDRRTHRGAGHMPLELQELERHNYVDTSVVQPDFHKWIACNMSQARAVQQSQSDNKICIYIYIYMIIMLYQKFADRIVPTSIFPWFQSIIYIMMYIYL